MMPKIQVPILLLLSLFNLAFLSPVFSQTTGRITGEVVDTTSREPLPGANVFLQGTALGASTDMKGKFEIESVPPGTYSIRVTYIGYDTWTTMAEIKAGGNLNFEIKLRPVALQSKEVLVTAQVSGQNQAINQQLSSQQIVNVVSAAKIQSLPDANAAESLGRLPGLSVLRSGGEATEVVIRGLAPKYNAVEVNGVRLNGSAQNASVDLSMISSDMLESMEVKKTVTPDMDADVIGGVVNLELREAHVEAPGVPIFNLTGQGGYNALSDAPNKYNNYKYVASAEDRLFDDNFGIFVQADVERKNLTSNELGAAYTNDGDLPDRYITQALNLENIPRDRERYDGALVLDYKLPAGTIKFSNFLSSGTTNAIDRTDFYGLTGDAGTSAGGSSNDIQNFVLSDTSTTLSVITNALHFQYQLPVFHLNAEVSHSYTESKDPNDWTVTFQGGSPGLGALTNETNLNPEAIPKAANSDINTTYLNNVTSQNSFTRARAIEGSLDLETNTNISNEITSDIKFGGDFRYVTRNYNYSTTGSQGFSIASAEYVDNLIASHFPSLASYANTSQLPMTPFIDPNYNYGKFLGGSYTMTSPLNYGMLSNLVNYLNKSATLISAHDPLSYFNDQFNSTTNNYNGHEDQDAAYVMATINIGPEISLIPGIRYQDLQTTYTGAQGIENTNSTLGGSYLHYDTTLTENHGYWLPDIALQYKPTSWFDVRLSYTNTLAYPDFQSIIPRIDVASGSIEWNNSQLSPSRSTNYDVNFSFYSNSIGLLTIGAFAKRITNLIFPYSFYALPSQALQYYPQELVAGSPAPTGNMQVSTFVNDSIPATDYGLEFDWETHFWYLPHPFDGLVLDVNYTHVFSQEKYPYVNEEKVGRALNYVDTSYTAPLLYQPDDIANVSIGYDFEGFSIRVSMIYQNSIFSNPAFYDYLRTTTAAYTRWDISAKQDLPLNIQLYGDLSNLNSEDDIQVIQASTGVPQSEQSYGMTADLGLRIKF
ncbi:MAG: TonB-dependent receptor [Candidatus Kryptoniota bacterium]